MKVAIAGASGSGKTTLAKALAAHFGWKFTENSAGLIIRPEDKEYLKDRYGYSGNWGQRTVINNSHKTPEFGRDFQRAILKARYLLKDEPGNHVYDRSSIDPMVFFLNQIVHNETQAETEAFMESCIAGLSGIDLVLRLPLQNPSMIIEDNNSRVANWFFQYKIDHLFDASIELICNPGGVISASRFRKSPITFERCPKWDWTARLEWAVACVNRILMYNGKQTI